MGHIGLRGENRGTSIKARACRVVWMIAAVALGSEACAAGAAEEGLGAGTEGAEGKRISGW